VPAASVTASLPLPEMTTVALALPADGRVTGTVYDLDGNDCSTASPLTDHVWATGATSAAGAADLVGWAMWFGNRQEGLRDRWLRLRTSRHYRGCPQP
jgi:hypothetical protein